MGARHLPRTVAWILLEATIAALFLMGWRYALDTPSTWGEWITGAFFAFTVLLAASLSGSVRWFFPVIIGSVLGSGILYVLTGSTWAAWGTLGAFFVALLWLEAFWARGQKHLRRWGTRLFLAGIAGVVPVALIQVQSHFADEEFFAALQALILGAFWFLLCIMPARNPPLAGEVRHARWWGLLLAVGLVVAAGWFLLSYQHSFYPPRAPAYPGITAQSPFLCGKVAADPQTYDGIQTFVRLGARVQDNQRKGPPEYGMLALSTGDITRAEVFRQALLNEAQQGRFTVPAHSIKFGQFEASLRAYYYFRLQQMFPSLFSPEERNMLQDWFAAINRRAFTVEWVDWMYALALAQWPSGLYENQENGAGLLAVLEYAGLADPQLSSSNREYLDRTPRGWEARFRNTDDAFIYQGEWLQNAFFQSLYTGRTPEINVRLSFEWLLLQSLPDGAPLRYNHPGALSLASLAYAGAGLLEDPRYIWLSGRAIDYLEGLGKGVAAQAGAENPISLPGISPTQGSCLLYGDSGLPNQVGPLSPDKLVFRDGWSSDASYLLLNLRFTGWHRYKATNTVTLVYQKGPLVADVLSGQRFQWLPAGRQLFRDKRIPRENLNGLLVERTGLSAVLYALTGGSSPWAQDPPYYAQVCSFVTGAEGDIAHTRLNDWHAWQHDRWVYFYESGPILVIDEASGPPNQRAAIAWHPATVARQEGWRFSLRGGSDAAELVLVPLSEGGGNLKVQDGGDSTMSIEYVRRGGQLRLLSVFLMDQWVGADVGYDVASRSVHIQSKAGQLTVPLPASVSCDSTEGVDSSGH